MFKFLTTYLVGLVGSMNIFSYQFIGKTPQNYWCNVEGLSNKSWTQDEVKQIAIPQYTINGKEEYSRCYMYNLDYEIFSNMSFEEAKQYLRSHSSNKTIKCTQRHFDGDIISFVTKWDLVCDRRSLYATVQSTIQSGFVIDSFLFGILTDRYGRKNIYLSCFGMVVFCGVVVTFVPYLWLFILLRMCLSTFSLSAINAGIVLCLEMCSVKRRSLIGPCFSLPWALGIIFLPLIAYYIRIWYYLQLAITLPFAFLFVVIWLNDVVSESPRWLILNKKFEEAYTVINKIAESNGNELPYKESMLKQMEMTIDQNDENVRQNMSNKCKSIMSFFTRKDLRVRTLIVSFVWFASSMIYYGVGLGADTINTNEYLFMFFGGIVEFLALLSLWPVTAQFGRKLTFFTYFFVSTITILTVAGLQYWLKESELEWLRVVLYLTGKFTIAAAFQLIWVYTSELYPTNLRCVASGGGSTIAKVGSFFSPYINDILGQKVQWAPATTFGGFSLVSAIAVIFLPETFKQNLTEDLPKIGVQCEGLDNKCADVEGA